MAADALESAPLAGRLFEIDAGATGTPEPVAP
jgi:hypothetical protein